jgi:hypothetical protein
MMTGKRKNLSFDRSGAIGSSGSKNNSSINGIESSDSSSRNTITDSNGGGGNGDRGSGSVGGRMDDLSGTSNMAKGGVERVGKAGEGVLGGMREIGRGMVREIGRGVDKLGGEKLLSGLRGLGGKSLGLGKFYYDKDVHPQLWRSWEAVMSGGGGTTTATTSNISGNWNWEERVTVNDAVGEVCVVAPARIGGIGMRGGSVGISGWDQVTGLWTSKDNVLTVFGGKGNRVGVTSINLTRNSSPLNSSSGGNWSEMVTRSLLLTGGRGSSNKSGKFKGKITSMAVLKSRRMVLVGDDRGDVNVVV